jgi:hypothetical protein
MQRWKCVDNEGDWKNNLSFVKDVCMISVNLIIIVVIVSKKKNMGHYFRTSPHGIE